jgi:hypothetical protein
VIFCIRLSVLFRALLGNTGSGGIPAPIPSAICPARYVPRSMLTNQGRVASVAGHITNGPDLEGIAFPQHDVRKAKFRTVWELKMMDQPLLMRTMLTARMPSTERQRHGPLGGGWLG